MVRALCVVAFGLLPGTSTLQAAVADPAEVDVSGAVRGDETPFAHQKAELLHAELTQRHPEFKKAMLLLGEEDTTAAAELLTRLAASPDDLLAAESAYFLARAYIIDEQLEQATSVLSTLGGKHGEHSLRQMETLYFTGICQAKLLQRSAAAQSLQRFLADYADAPQRMRVAATEELMRLEAIDDGTLADIQTRMEYVRRRLAIRESGRRTQVEQDRIIAMLDELLKPRDGGDGPSPEDPPKDPRPPGDDPPHDHPHPGTPRPGPGVPNSDGAKEGGSGATDDLSQPVRRGTRSQRNGSNSWDHVNDKDRQAKAFAALKAKFPERYAELVKQYFRSCMEESGE